MAPRDDTRPDPFACAVVAFLFAFLGSFLVLTVTMIRLRALGDAVPLWKAFVFPASVAGQLAGGAGLFVYAVVRRCP